MCNLLMNSLFRVCHSWKSMLEELIKFRDLADTLTDKEFDLFLSKFFSKFDKRQFILKSLFHLFNAQNDGDNDNQDINLSPIMDIIASIIKSRQHKQLGLSQNENEPTISILDLPSDIIGFCASYLEFASYKLFERCSRQIYISCNNANTLQLIDGDTFIKNEENIEHLTKPQYLQSLKCTQVTNFKMNVDSYVLMNYLYDMPLSRISPI